MNKNIVLVLFGFLLAVSVVKGYPYNCGEVGEYPCHLSEFRLKSSCTGTIFKTCINDIVFDESTDRMTELIPVSNGLSLYHQSGDIYGSTGYITITERKDGHITNYIYIAVEGKTSSPPEKFSEIIVNGHELHRDKYYGDYPNSYIDELYVGSDTILFTWFDDPEVKVNNLEQRVSFLEQWKTTIDNTITTIQITIADILNRLGKLDGKTTTTTTIPTTTTITSTTILTTTTTIQSTTLTTIQTTSTLPPTTTTTIISQCQQICQNWYGKNGVCRNSCLGGEKYNGLRDCPSGQKCCCV